MTETRREDGERAKIEVGLFQIQKWRNRKRDNGTVYAKQPLPSGSIGCA